MTKLMPLHPRGRKTIDQEETKEWSNPVGIAEEDTDKADAQHTDNHARNMAVATILLKFANNEIRAKNLRRRTS